MYEVFEVKPPDAGKVTEILSDTQDDLVSRQSVVIRDGPALGFPALGQIVMIEGTEAGVKRAIERFAFATKLTGETREAVYRAIKAQEDEAASGMGFIFG